MRDIKTLNIKLPRHLEVRSREQEAVIKNELKEFEYLGIKDNTALLGFSRRPTYEEHLIIHTLGGILEKRMNIVN